MLPKSRVQLATLILLISIGIYPGKTEDVNSYKTCIQKEVVVNAFTSTKACLHDIIKSVKENKAVGNCSSVSDFKKSYRNSFHILSHTCGEYIQTANVTNSTTMINKVQFSNLGSFLKYNLNKTLLEDVFKTNGTVCLRNKMPDLIQCVKENTHFNVNDGEIFNTARKSDYLLWTMEKIGWSETSCSVTKRNKECFHKKLANCTAVDAYISSQFDMILDVCDKRKPLTPPAAVTVKDKGSNKTTSIVIATVLVIMAVGVIGILFKYRHQISSKIKSRPNTAEQCVEYENKSS